MKSTPSTKKAELSRQNRVGIAEGKELGKNDTLGPGEGSAEGIIVGLHDGTIEGVDDGAELTVGGKLGFVEGEAEGDTDMLGA